MLAASLNPTRVERYAAASEIEKGMMSQQVEVVNGMVVAANGTPLSGISIVADTFLNGQIAFLLLRPDVLPCDLL